MFEVLLLHTLSFCAAIVNSVREAVLVDVISFHAAISTCARAYCFMLSASTQRSQSAQREADASLW
eukprot:1826892-Karenia_brevis.AAC.1